MKFTFPASWRRPLKAEQTKLYFTDLQSKVRDAYQTNTIYPPQTDIFNALSLCPFEQVKVVILGQDPYHGDKQAHGLSFSVPAGVKVPPSLRNIYKEIESDLGIKMPESGNLERWATQGVLLLNATLTVEAGQAGSHQKLGWEQLTDAIIQAISAEREHVVFLLWGKYAQTKAAAIDQTKHLVLQAPHPSPFSAYTGFFGCKHFSKTNTYLTQHHLPPIVW